MLLLEHRHQSVWRRIAGISRHHRAGRYPLVLPISCRTRMQAVLALERSHITCWIAPRDVIASNHVGKEVERASSKRRPIVALRTDAAPLTPALEYFLSESQWIDSDATRSEKAVTQVVNAVRRHMAGEHAIDPRADSNIPHTPKSGGEWQSCQRSPSLDVSIVVTSKKRVGSWEAIFTVVARHRQLRNFSALSALR
jgi:hypothetical protein